MSLSTNRSLLAARILLPLAAAVLAAMEFRYLLAFGMTGDYYSDLQILFGISTALSAIALAAWIPWLAASLFVASSWSGLLIGDLALASLAALPCTLAAIISLRWRTIITGGIVLAAVLTLGGVRSTAPPPQLQVLLFLAATVAGAASGLLTRIVKRQLEARDAELTTLEARLAAVRHDERTALARQLHDLIGHSLSTIALQGEAYSDSEDPAELKSALSRMRGESVKAVDQLQLLVGLLRDAELDADGPNDLNTMAEPPSQVLARLVTELEALGFQVTPSCDPRAESLGPVLRTFLGRFLTESVTNIQRYAEPATHCTLTISLSGQLEAVAMSVLASDPQPGTSSSLGLIGLEESARILGGNLTWAEVDGQWQVRAQVPLQQS